MSHKKTFIADDPPRAASIAIHGRVAAAPPAANAQQARANSRHRRRGIRYAPTAERGIAIPTVPLAMNAPPAAHAAPIYPSALAGPRRVCPAQKQASEMITHEASGTSTRR